MNDPRFSGYWDYIRASSSPDRAVRKSLEGFDDERFLAWLWVSETVDQGDDEAIAVIIGVARLGQSSKEVNYVCVDLVESFEAEGGDIALLRERAQAEVPELVPEIDRMFS